MPCALKNMKPFLHKYLRSWRPPACLHRQNAMPHIKTYARVNPSSGMEPAVDWAILTSANLSKAAWGALQKKDTQLMIRSYELGVLCLPAPNGTPSSRSQGLSLVGREKAVSNARLLPLPYELSLKTYDPTTDEPWVWDLVRNDPDIFGNCYAP